MNIALQKKGTLSTYEFLFDQLKSWGVTSYSGVTGGGVIHFLKHLSPLQHPSTEEPSFFTVSEYVAGFIPLGYFLASGKIAAAVATTGAATKLLTCGLSDAKLHNIPSVYIVPITNTDSIGFSALQDTSIYGSNMVEQLKAELPDSVFVLDNRFNMPEQLTLAKRQLDCSKPVVLVLDNTALNGEVSDIFPLSEEHLSEHATDFSTFIATLREACFGKHLTILVGEEMARYDNGADLTSSLSESLKATTVWTINGANAVSSSNPYGFGYISFGGNDRAIEAFKALGQDDVLLLLGACPDEYTTNLSRIHASETFFVNGIADAYGLVGNSLQHMVDGVYHQVQGPLDAFVNALIMDAENVPFPNVPAAIAPFNLNTKPIPKPRAGYVDMADLFLRLNARWPQETIAFDDVCLAYKDRQYVTQRPNENARFFSLYRGSAMGGAFGAAIGAKMAKPNATTVLFTGDGCFRLFAGSLGEVSSLGLVVFLLNNETLSIVEQGLQQLLPDTPDDHYHARVTRINYCQLAEACHWEAVKLQSDLSNLDDILAKIGEGKNRSLLIEVPVDPLQVLGNNPRLNNL
ncbi:thiamine pyrophosphate-dependent enzyme [Olivibacter sp. 47]|uniref:thiamine pyrophosphate-dependent enzyme n=1 Tax=Olivibacter sp. 47 TaxID=3056486 RepID=UPI0025A3645E|nr:thiamine pyrophosphate-dependent enzyme [Olivibacter sp. 47]MDM8176440.1 thiamine pyrophosphate-dependent enzyme [Olivibacter sp. 47]